MDEKILFGQKLLALRKRSKKSQAEIAQLLGITTSAYQNYENGRREAGYSTISKLADFYGVTTDYLLGREPAPNPLKYFKISPKPVDNDEFIKLYSELPELVREIFIDTMSKLSQAALQIKYDITKSERHEAVTGELLDDEQAEETDAG